MTKNVYDILITVTHTLASLLQSYPQYLFHHHVKPGQHRTLRFPEYVTLTEGDLTHKTSGKHAGSYCLEFN